MPLRVGAWHANFYSLVLSKRVLLDIECADCLFVCYVYLLVVCMYATKVRESVCLLSGVPACVGATSEGSVECELLFFDTVKMSILGHIVC